MTIVRYTIKHQRAGSEDYDWRIFPDEGSARLHRPEMANNAEAFTREEVLDMRVDDIRGMTVKQLAQIVFKI
jgi:hypothetical protein